MVVQVKKQGNILGALSSCKIQTHMFVYWSCARNRITVAWLHTTWGMRWTSVHFSNYEILLEFEKKSIGKNPNFISSLITTWAVCLIKYKAKAVICLSIYKNVCGILNFYLISMNKFPIGYNKLPNKPPRSGCGIVPLVIFIDYPSILQPEMLECLRSQSFSLL